MGLIGGHAAFITFIRKNKSIKCLNACYAVLCALRRKASRKSGETTRQSAKAEGFEVRGIAVGGPAPPLTGDPAGPVFTPSSIPQLFGESYYVPGSVQGPSNTQGNKLDKVSVADQIPHFRSPPPGSNLLATGQGMWQGAEGMCPHVSLQSLSSPCRNC